MNQAELREEICRVGASLFARGYVHATAGNIIGKAEPGRGNAQDLRFQVALNGLQKIVRDAIDPAMAKPRDERAD